MTRATGVRRTRLSSDRERPPGSRTISNLSTYNIATYAYFVNLKRPGKRKFSETGCKLTPLHEVKQAGLCIRNFCDTGSAICLNVRPLSDRHATAIHYQWADYRNARPVGRPRVVTRSLKRQLGMSNFPVHYGSLTSVRPAPSSPSARAAWQVH